MKKLGCLLLLFWYVAVGTHSAYAAHGDGARGYAGTMEFFGKVHAVGKGIPNVAVSDGLQVTYTDTKGNYSLISSTEIDFVFISLPAGYTVFSKKGILQYFEHIRDKAKKKQRIDFELTVNPVDEHQHTLIVCADPQVGFEGELPQLDVVLEDMKMHVLDNFPNKPVYGMVLGDIVENIQQISPTFADIRQRFNDTQIPFFYVAGNHDLDMDIRSNFQSLQSYEKHFGPSYYSFNRGEVHYVVLNDVFSTGKPNGYIGYLEEKQLRWLEQDLTRVPEGTTVIVSLHIPTYSAAARRGDYGKEDIKKVMQNRQALYTILAPYNAHIFSGHEHYHENYVLKDNLFEHVHSALCGIFWQAPFNSDGTPLGYTVYEIDGDKLTWYFKAAGKDKDTQFTAYMPGADKDKSDALIVNVWNYDPQWKVYWYEDGVKRGEMEQFVGWDPDIVQYVAKNQQDFRYKYIGAGTTEHLFYAVPLDKQAQFEIKVVDRFNNTYSAAPKHLH